MLSAVQQHYKCTILFFPPHLLQHHLPRRAHLHPQAAVAAHALQSLGAVLLRVGYHQHACAGTFWNLAMYDPCR